MNLISESWSCPSCGTRFNSTYPSTGYAPTASVSSSRSGTSLPWASYGDLPPCPDCGGQLVEVIRQLSHLALDTLWGARSLRAP